jgi:putative spermidine/putrescine transport system ATP-binding protein
MAANISGNITGNVTGNISGNTARDAAGAGSTRRVTRTHGTSVVLQNLSRSFGATKALDGLSIEMAPGELVALLGPSGCGKTTALRIVAGFETADTGSVLVDGKDISSVPAAKRDMGMVFQSYSLFPNMIALDNVAFGLRMRKVGTSGRRKRAGELLELVGLAPQAGRYPHQLSGGQQQRVALARALAIEPRLLLLDEPLSALDAKVRLQLREQIRTIQQRLGTTTLFVTHDQEEALSMADRVGVMSHGKLEQIDAPDQLYDHPATAFVAEFVGVMNRIPAELTGDETVTCVGCTVPVKGGSARGLSGDVDLLVRPEGLTMQVVENGNGIVTTKTFLGSVTRVGVLLSGDVSVQIDQSSSEAAALTAGTSVQVSLPPEPVLVAPRRLRASQALEREGRDDAQFGVPVAGITGHDGDRQGEVSRELAMQRGEVVGGVQRRRPERRVVVHHGGHDGQVLRVVDQLDHAGLARPVRHGARGHLPEPTGRVSRVAVRADRVGVRMTVQPQDHVREPVHEGKQVGRGQRRLDARPRVCTAAIVQRVAAVMREQDYEPVVVAGLDLLPVRAAVRRVHLAEPGFQPAGLISVKAPGRPAGQAVRVQRDEPYRGRVVDVIRGAVQPVALAEPVPERPRAGPEVGVDEIPPADRPAEGIGRDRPRRAGHERLGAGGEQLEGLVMVEVGRQSGRLLATG